jgi:hypothetical protein
MKRRKFLKHLAATPVIASSLAWEPRAQQASRTEIVTSGQKPIEIGSSRQLFLNDSLFANQDGLKLTLHPPVLRETAVKCDRPWEKKMLHFSCVIPEGNRFRMWYGVYDGDLTKNAATDVNWWCYAESNDGINWEKPNLGLVTWQGSRDNNIIFPTEGIKGANASVLLDHKAPADERYKMITRSRQIHGYVSADGLRWRPVQPDPLISDGPVDSFNVLLWDDERQRYVIYLRGTDKSVPGSFKGGRRAIRRSESADFHNWSKPEFVVTADANDPTSLNFYTNAAVKYDRAPHTYLMFPMIYYPERSYPGTPLPGLSDIQFAASRDGINWERRFRQPFIKPGLDERNWVDRNPIMGLGMIETGPGEISMYYSDLYRSPETRLRRGTLRTDGFVSVEGPYSGWGEFTTKALTFAGKRLEMNYSTSGGGALMVELQDESGKAQPGFTLEDCPEIYGDKIAGVVRWKRGDDVGSLAGKPGRLRVRLRDAHLYAFRFA